MGLGGRWQGVIGVTGATGVTGVIGVTGAVFLPLLDHQAGEFHYE